MNCREHNKMKNILKSVENEGREEDNEHGLLDSGRDSGISSDSPRYQETNAKVSKYIIFGILFLFSKHSPNKKLSP